jgi:ERCC4-type nuclease
MIIKIGKKSKLWAGHYLPTIPDGFCILVDTQEWTKNHNGYKFDDLKIDTIYRNLGHHGADYSILGFEHDIRIERKSQEDFYGSIGYGRERFDKTIEELKKLEFAGLVIEAAEEDLLHPELTYSNISANSVYGTLISYEINGIHVYCGTRENCRYKMINWLLKFYKEKRGL